MNVSISGRFKGGKPESALPVACTYDIPAMDDEYSSPAGISDSQRREVMLAVRMGYSTPEAISEHLYLELWIVKRRLFELNLGPDPRAKPKSVKSNPPDVINKIRKILSKPMKSAEIARAVGVPVQSCLGILRSSPVFRCSTVGRGNRFRLVWSLSQSA